MSGADFFRGVTLEKIGKEKTVTISWKQGSFLGIGGDMTQTYDIYKYENPANKGCTPVYVQTGMTAPQRLLLDDNVQYGCNDGIVFFVIHDKSQTPYQHRFIQNHFQKLAYVAHEWIGIASRGALDLTWCMGDYLHDL